MSGWNRLTNGERDALSKLPVWTTEADRRLALTYVGPPLRGVLEAIRAVTSGAPAPTNLGVLVAIARYEDAGWMPDGCFERWRRWGLQGHEHLNVQSLVQWLDTYERTLRCKLRDLETILTQQCHQQEKNRAMAQEGATLANQRLHTHYQKLILACLSVGDTAGAQEITQRMSESARIEIDRLFHAHVTQHNPNTTGMGEDTIASCPDIRGTPANTDLTDEHLSDLLSGYSGVAGTNVIERMATEIRRHRAIREYLASESNAESRELAERRGLDIVRRAEIDELVARRQADLCAEEREALAWLKQLMGSTVCRDSPHNPVLDALAKRLLRSNQ
jgi:hypothetical protein